MNLDSNNIYHPLSRPFPWRIDAYRRFLPYDRIIVEKRDVISVASLAFRASFPDLKGKKLAFASDFHFTGDRTDLRIVDDLCAALRQFRPDYLLLGGDLTADAIEIPKLPLLLEPLRETAPRRIVIPGNWERGKTWISQAQWRAYFDGFGFRYLCNEHETDEYFDIYGVDDLSNGYPLLPRKWADKRCHILMAHRPDTIIALDDGNPRLAETDLVLCGHTHGGQIRLPLIGAVYASSKYGCKFDYGLYHRDNMKLQMFVSSGISHRSLPWRWRCRRELVQITFQ